MITFGERVKLKRKELGITQDALAKRVGYTSRAAICLIEKGKTDITATQVKKIADALHTTPDYLLGGKEKPISKKDELLTLFNQVPDEKKQFVLDLIRSALNMQK